MKTVVEFGRSPLVIGEILLLLFDAIWNHFGFFSFFALLVAAFSESVDSWEDEMPLLAGLVNFSWMSCFLIDDIGSGSEERWICLHVDAEWLVGFAFC